MGTAMREEKLDFWFKHGFNVCFIGRHGVGKTAMINACFERAGLKQGSTFLYFSGSTLDPWVDFVGVPRERKDEQTGLVYLDLVRPKPFANDEVEAIFVEEFNRAPKKVRNAVMELLQFKSINGKRFPKLRVVWTAINPDEDDEYDVEKMDPAQMDRFQVSVVVPYKPNEGWFTQRYGERVARAALQWWSDLSADEQKLVSPRRLEYALNMWEAKGDMRDVLPMSSCVMKLMQSLNTGPISERVEELFKTRDASAAKLFLSNENNYNPAIKVITESEAMMEFFLPLLTKEKISVLMSNHERACRFMTSTFQQYPIFQDVMRDILEANQNKPLVKKIRRALTENVVMANGFGPTSGGQPAAPHFSKLGTRKGKWADSLSEFKKWPLDKPADRTKLYSELVTNLPEKMSGDEALETLELFNEMASRAWTTTVNGGDMKLLINMVNHCIAQLSIGKRMGWNEIVNAYGGKLKNLLDKLREANLATQVFTPAKA